MGSKHPGEAILVKSSNIQGAKGTRTGDETFIFLLRTWRGSPDLRERGERNCPSSREIPQYIPRTGYQSGSLWLIDADQKNHSYLLNWYYTSWPHQSATYSRDPPREHPGDYLRPFENDTRQSKLRRVLGSPLWRSIRILYGASTSGPSFRESILQHHDSGNLGQPAKSHWCARSGPAGGHPQPQASFLEPPDFNWYMSDNYKLSDRILEEQDQILD